MDRKKQYNILIVIGILLVLVGVFPLLSSVSIPKNPTPFQQYYSFLMTILFLILPITTIATGVFIWQRARLEETKKKNMKATALILLMLVAFGISIAWWIAASNA